MAEIVTGLTVAGLWVAANYTGMLTSLSGIGAPVLVKKFLINPLIKKKNTKKLLKYLTDEDVEVVLEKVIFFLKDLDYQKIYIMKQRVKKYKKLFKKITITKSSEKLLTYVFESLKDDKTFGDFNEKIQLIDNITEVLMVTRKVSSSEIKKIVTTNTLEILIDLDISDIKKLLYYIESQKEKFLESLKKDDIIGDLESKLDMNDFKDTLIHLLKKINFDLERKYQVAVSRSEDDILVSMRSESKKVIPISTFGRKIKILIKIK